MTQRPSTFVPWNRQVSLRQKPSQAWIAGILAFLGGLFLLDVGCWVFAENLWFEEVGYGPNFWLRCQARLSIWAIALLLSGAFLGFNFSLARRLIQPPWEGDGNPLQLPKLQLGPEGDRDRVAPLGFGAMGLRGLVATVIGLSALLSLLLYHYSLYLRQAWEFGAPLLSQTPPLPIQFDLYTSIQDIQQLSATPWQGLALLGSMGLVAIAPWTTLIVEAVLLTLGLGFLLSNHWIQILPAFRATAFGTQDPQFGQDISFYVFSLPLLELLRFWLVGLLLFALLAIVLLYICGDGSLSRGIFRGFSAAQQRHLYGLGGGCMVAVALSHWLSRYGRLYGGRASSFFGASYTDVRVQLPVDVALTAIASLLAMGLFLRATGWRFRAEKRRDRPSSRSRHPPSHSPTLQFLRVHPFLDLGLGYLLLVLVVGNALPMAIQQLVVLPNEFEREAGYIDRSIAATRQAFDLEDIDVKTFEPTNNLSQADLANNRATLDNIRIWDTRPLLLANRQLQQIRLYYSFPDADIDRYAFNSEADATRKQQVIIAARELDYNSVPEAAKTWVNQHLVYTHGYGFTLSPVNTVTAEGLPTYFVRDIGENLTLEGNDSLGISQADVRRSIPIGAPRIYYGGLTDTYVMTATRNLELDYPSGDNNAENRYNGGGGIRIGNILRRWAFAVYLRDWQMALTRSFTPQTQLLFRRNIKARIQAIAPFLRYDADPYLVIADDPPAPQRPNNLYWMVDAYTTSDRYPYSDPGQHPFNYIRNSVKVVIDAYNGSVHFYIADGDDPVIQTWNRIFPGMLEPLAAMPESLRSHIRYPVDLFSVQSERLLAYHMTDAKPFYNREDQWQVPTEIYANEPQPVEPYYLTMRLPTETAEEFVLLHPFTPVRRNNLTAWLAGRSDGENYGKLLLYQFPKQRLVYGPEQIEARVNQDPRISQLISLWNREGSRVVQGNLLVIPIEDSLLYVEPLYLEAERNSIPTLIRVIVAYGNRIVMEENLERGLALLFEAEVTPSATSSSEAVNPASNAVDRQIPGLPSLDLDQPIITEIGDPDDPNLTLPSSTPE